MSVVRVEKSKDFTIMSNYHLQDPNLSLKAKGLLSFMLSLREDWSYSISGFASVCKEGKDAIRSTIQELEAARYIIRRQMHNADGSFGGNEYIVHERPQLDEGKGEAAPLSENPTTVDPTTGNPLTENPTQINTNVKSTDLNNPPYSPPTGDAPPKKSSRRPVKTEPVYRPDWFARFWALYPRRTARAAAVRAWDKLRPDLELCRVMTAAIKAQMQTPQWREGPDHIPHPATWLNGARWLDEVALSPPPESTGWAPDPEVY